jgi:hypothetical protein
MTGRHEGLTAPSDIWLQDQARAWLEQAEAHVAKVMAGSTRCRSESSEELMFRIGWMLEEQGELLCRARLLFAEVLDRG